MPGYNPYGIIKGMGRVGQEPQYTSIGTYDGQEWVFPDHRQGHFDRAAFDQGGYGGSYQHGYNGYPLQFCTAQNQAWLRGQCAEPVDVPGTRNPPSDRERAARASTVGPYWRRLY
jgi:hypothetical protein